MAVDGITVRLGRVTIEVSEHAIERFQQRCRPGLDLLGAAAELRRLVEAVGAVVAERPVWMNGVAEKPTAYLMLGPDVALPVAFGKASTCVTRGEPSDAALADRQAARRARSQARAYRRGRGSQAGDGNEATGRLGAGRRKRAGGARG